ncbi:hypothetical protein ACIPSA_47780 [Streptomyces sp. NPDC086549]|uniref:hypothetical protein n=1 Tax=Streptomyces sp. NPDC086549 TaxID=3365752 RepID=UPI00380B7FA2
MPELIDPTAGLRTPFLAAVSEFREVGDYPVPWFVTDVIHRPLTDAVVSGALVPTAGSPFSWLNAVTHRWQASTLTWSEGSSPGLPPTLRPDDPRHDAPAPWYKIQLKITVGKAVRSGTWHLTPVRGRGRHRGPQRDAGV